MLGPVPCSWGFQIGIPEGSCRVPKAKKSFLDKQGKLKCLSPLSFIPGKSVNCLNLYETIW